MTEHIIKTIISYLVPAIFGFLLALLKNYKKKNDTIKEELSALKNANMIQLQSNLTNTYYYYEPLHKWPDYICKNFLNELKAYEDLGGDDYVHILAEHAKTWEVIRTDILKDSK